MEQYMTLLNDTHHQTATQIPARPFDKLFWTGSIPKVRRLFFWLYGPAGAGKTAILQAIAEFMCSSSESDKNFFSFLEER
jgi:SpoVK/Ycf46/Vps4 family AAA+-type ATPase